MNIELCKKIIARAKAADELYDLNRETQDLMVRLDEASRRRKKAEEDMALTVYGNLQPFTTPDEVAQQIAALSEELGLAPPLLKLDANFFDTVRAERRKLVALAEIMIATESVVEATP